MTAVQPVTPSDYGALAPLTSAPVETGHSPAVVPLGSNAPNNSRSAEPVPIPESRPFVGKAVRRQRVEGCGKRTSGMPLMRWSAPGEVISRVCLIKE